MAKVEFTCTDDYKADIKAFADKKGITVAAYVKSSVFEQMKKDEKKGS